MKISSELLKVEILEKLLWEKNFVLGTTEYNNYYGIADVMSVSKTLFSWEFEIKVSKQDLMSEINAIDLVLTNDMPRLSKKYFNKYIKHQSYISLYNRKEGLDREYKNIPNYFLFFIPKKLEEFALDILKDTPYGLYVYDPEHRLKRKRIVCIKKPIKIHNKKIEIDDFPKYAKRLSSENVSIRKKRLKEKEK